MSYLQDGIGTKAGQDATNAEIFVNGTTLFRLEAMLCEEENAETAEKKLIHHI